VDRETLLSDERLARLEETLRRTYTFPKQNTDLVTFVQPPTDHETDSGVRRVPGLAIFAIVSDNPRSKGHRIMTTGSTYLETWEREDKTRSHFVGVKDMAQEIYGPIVKAHLETMKNYNEMI
jgi:hypothetical protein